MSLPLLHAGRTNPGLSAALDLRFALDKSLTAYRGPTPSFSRASSGTYFGSDGILRTMGLNLLLYSEDFTNGTYWSGGSTTRSGNTAVAPDGSLTADTITFNSGSQIYQNPQISSSIGTISVYVKKVDHRYFSAQIETSSTAHRAVFDLDTALVTETTSGTSASISDAGNGWFRCSVTKTVAGTTAIWATFQQSATATFSTGSGSKQFYMWGAQSEIGSSLNTYSKTTSASNSGPRFDHTYNGTSWISRGLLVEEQRTNLFQQSEDFSNAYWTKDASSITANSIAAPDGNTTADKIVEDTQNRAHAVVRNFTITAGTVYTLSVFAKAGERTWVTLNLSETGVSDRNTYFNLSDGTIGTNATGNTATITPVGNGWYRCSASRTVSVSNPRFFIELASADGTRSYAGDGSSGAYFWGAQLEANAFPTSYIPTTSASATRSADVCQITGSDFSSFWNASEGSFACEVNPLGGNDIRNQGIVTANDGTFSNVMGQIRNIQNTVGDYGAFCRASGTTTMSIVRAAGSTQVGVTFQAATGFKANDCADSLNGGAVITDGAVTLPTVNRITIGDFHTGANTFLNGHIARLRYFNRRLTDKQLEDLCRPEDQLKLDLKFSENLSLTPVVGPTPSFSRASTGTYFNSSGVLTSAAINAPRFDHTYNGTSWISKGLLIEEQRTNIVTNSNNFSNWTQNTINASSSAGLSPDGTSNAWKIYPTSAGGSLQNSNVNLANTALIFSLIDGSLTSTIIGTATSSAENVGNGWFRIRMTTQGYTFTVFSKPAGWNYICLQFSSTNAYIYPAQSGTAIGSPSGTDGILIYGAQIESGAFPTSYIPTTTTSVVRSADVCQITGADFSGFYNQSEGSFAVEYDRIFTPSSSAKWIMQIDDGTNSERIGFVYEPSVAPVGDQMFVIDGGSLQARVGSGSFVSATPGKFASCYKLNDFAATLNGSAVNTDTSGTLPTVNKIDIGRSQPDSNYLNGHIARLRYYAIRLPNRLLIAKSQ